MIRFVFALASFLAVWSSAANAVVRIADDPGGQIGTYIDRYEQLRSSGETVMIDGPCLSACTIVLGAIPHDRICVTSKANLGFHTAWDPGMDGRAYINEDASQMLYLLYPSPVRRWISARGGLTPKMKYLRGKALFAMYKHCSEDARAQASRTPLQIVPAEYRK